MPSKKTHRVTDERLIEAAKAVGLDINRDDTRPIHLVRAYCGYAFHDTAWAEVMISVMEGAGMKVNRGDMTRLESVRDTPKTKSDIVQLVAAAGNLPVEDIKLSDVDAADMKGLPAEELDEDTGDKP